MTATERIQEEAITKEQASQPIPPRYSSALASKGGLVTETRMVLEALAQGETLDSVRHRVFNENLLNKQTSETRKTIWGHIQRRYFIGRSDEEIAFFARVATSPAFPPQAHNLILFYTFAQSDNLLYDVTVNLLYGLHHTGRSTISKADMFQWLERESRNGHPEIDTWSPQTRSKLVRHLLSITRDFGLLSGGQNKMFHRVYVPLPAFIYVVYDQARQGLTGRHLVAAEPFRLFLMDHDDVLLLLGEAARFDYLTIRHTDTIYDIRLHYANLEEAMNNAIAQAISGA